MRINHLLVTAPLKDRVVWAEIDREARKGKPLPSDHAPLVMPAGLRQIRESWRAWGSSDEPHLFFCLGVSVR
jgi:hypothetical protein